MVSNDTRLLWIYSAIPLVALNTLVFFPFLIYCILEVKRYWHDRFFQIRRPILILGFIVPMSLYTIGDIIVYFVYLAIYSDSMSEIYDFFYGCLFYPMISMAETVMIMRIWILYFDSNVSRLVKNSKWQVSINPSIMEDSPFDHGFYLNAKTQRRWASGGFLFKIACALLVLETTVYILIYAVFQLYAVASIVEASPIIIKVMSTMNCL